MINHIIENITKLILYATNETISQINDNLHIEVHSANEKRDTIRETKREA